MMVGRVDEFQTPRVWGEAISQLEDLHLLNFQTPRVWGEAEEVAFLVEAWEFQTPRVWGEDLRVYGMALAQVSDPTRVGRGSITEISVFHCVSKCFGACNFVIPIAMRR